MHDLQLRFESPDEKNRWDSPLFVIDNNSKNSSKIESVFKTLIITTSESASSPVGAATSATPQTESEQPLEINIKQQPAAPIKSSWKRNTQKKNAIIGDDDEAASVITAIQSSTKKSTTGQLSISGTVIDNTKCAHVRSMDSFDEVFPKILHYFNTAIAPTPNASTLPIHHASADALYELDSISKRISDAILLHQNNSLEGTPIIFIEYNRTLELHRHVSIAELQRHRKQFIKINSMHHADSQQEIGSQFIEFLSQNI